MNSEPHDSMDELALDLGKSIHIGAIIKEKLDRDRRSISWFSEQMNCDRSNMYKMLSRSHLDTNFVLRASKVLEHNFFKDISDELKSVISNGWSDLIIS